MGAVDGTSVTVTNPTDADAVARIRQQVADPMATTARVRGYYQDAFRRLYMQRNLLLHGGRCDSIALSATMRTLPALVAAGLDRLVHAAMQKPTTDPFILAARADNELSFQGTQKRVRCTDSWTD